MADRLTVPADRLAMLADQLAMSAEWVEERLSPVFEQPIERTIVWLSSEPHSEESNHCRPRAWVDVSREFRS